MIPPIEDALDELIKLYAFQGKEAVMSALELKLDAIKDDNVGFEDEVEHEDA